MANISQIQLPSGVTYNIKDKTSGYITGMTILSYGSSTWQNFIDAYNANKVVYCRASSNNNPATGSQTRLAFMAYVNNATTPTEVEFQYYRSVSSHSASQQGDQVYVYKLNKSTGWSVITREAMSKIAAGGDLTSSYANGTITISGNIPTVPTNVSAFTNDAGYITGYTETDPTVPAWAKASSKPSYTASEVGAVPTSRTVNGKALSSNITLSASDVSAQETLVSGTNIKTVNSTSLLGSGDVAVQPTLVSGTNIKTVNNESLLGSGNITIQGGGGDTVSFTQTQQSGNELGTITINGTGTNIYSPTETDPVFSASAAAGITSSDISTWNGKQDALVSGTNIKTVNGNSLLGSGDLPIQGGGDKNIWYGTCTTVMVNQNKVVTTSSGDFELVDGNIVVIYFEHPVIGVPTLNVDGTGATSIYYNDGSEHVFQEESSVSFVFDNRIGSFVAINRAEAYGSFYGLVKGNDIPHDISQISITVANWNATTTCTKSVTGVTASNSIIVSPAPASIADYVSAGVYCSAQGSGTLTFTASSTPTADLVVNVMVVG